MCILIVLVSPLHDILNNISNYTEYTLEIFVHSILLKISNWQKNNKMLREKCSYIKIVQYQEKELRENVEKLCVDNVS